jgi:cAMP-dependent protein kinase regulator
MLSGGNQSIQQRDPVIPKRCGSSAGSRLALLHSCARAATVLSVGTGVLWGLDRTTFRSIVLGINASQCATYEKALERNPLLQDLSHAERVRLTHAMEKKVFEDGTVVIQQGDTAHAMYVVACVCVDPAYLLE